ncbi:MAG: methyltransferase domain-containing protein, partial [Gammaproteobacteria bacterium]|nr:methyltransferase domain-containing protein [Gammaproteobacteria bacterium]
DAYFRFYSSMRYNAQEMVFRSVTPMVDRNLDALIDQSAAIRAAHDQQPELRAEFAVPDSVSKIDVHLAPGSYHTEYAPGDVAAGAVYDNSINVFAFNQMGEDISDIGHTMANYVRLKLPELSPQRILDCGCTIGSNTVPWKKVFPQADVHAIDVSAPLLRYAAARAASMDADISFRQMNATELDYPDNSFDIVFSSMFLHELPLKDIRAYLAEARRVLRPGGLLLTMELPSNASMAPYEQFYLDWDCYYNKEPFYKPFRDQDYRELCTTAGFPADSFFEFAAPRYTYMDEADFLAGLNEQNGFDDHTGTLRDGLRWYAFGSRKPIQE